MDYRSAREGVALITTLAIVVVVSILVFGSVLTTQLELSLTRNDVNATQAQYVAQAGLQTYKAALFQTYRYVLLNTDTVADPCASAISTEIDFLRNGDALIWVADRIDLPDIDVLDGNGGRVGVAEVELLRDPSFENRITIRSVGRATSDGTAFRATSTAAATFNLSTGSGIEQAIFAGAGSNMRSVNGNANVYGGVYIEGDDEDQASSVFNPGGSFSMYNSYDASALNQGNYRPADLMREPAVGNLCASLRVGYGTVNVGNAVQLGTPTSPLYSVAVGQVAGSLTYSGDVIEGDTDAFCSRNHGVCSTKPVGRFDLSEPPAFPKLDGDPANAELCDANSVDWRDCIQREAAADGIAFTALESTISVSPPGDTDVTACPELADLDLDGTLVFGTTAFTCGEVVDGDLRRGFEYTVTGPSNARRGVLRVKGNVTMEGINVEFGLPTEYRASSLDGNNAAFSVLALTADGTPRGGDVRIQSDFVTDQSVQDDGSTFNKYPDTVLALYAEDMVTVNGGSGTTVTAPVYAGSLFRIRANSTLIGQVITDSFCSMGNPNSDDCNTNGAPPTIIYSSAGDNRPKSYRAMAEPGGTPTFDLLSYEMR